MSSPAGALRAKRDLNGNTNRGRQSLLPNGPWCMIRLCGQLLRDHHVRGRRQADGRAPVAGHGGGPMRLAALSSDTMTPEQVGLYREILSGPRGQGPRAVLLA